MKLKITLIGLFILMLILSSCMPVFVSSLEQDKQLTYIKEMPNFTKEQLYKKALNWVAINFNSANAVIQLKDEEQGRLVCKGSGSFYYMMWDRHFDYTLIIDTKDSKIRLSFEHITSRKVGDVYGPDLVRNWKLIKNYFDTFSSKFFSDLNNVKSENW